MEQKVQIELNANDLNLVLIALGQLPYNQVHELINRIHGEVGQQLTDAEKTNTDSNIKQMNTN